MKGNRCFIGMFSTHALYKIVMVIEGVLTYKLSSHPTCDPGVLGSCFSALSR